MEEKEPETKEDTPEPQSGIAAANGQTSSLAANTQDTVGDEMKEKESGDGKQLSKAEMLIDKIETRRDQRREVTWRVRTEFIDICEERVAKLGGSELNAIPFNELVRMKEECVNDPELYEVLQLAEKSCEEVKSLRFYFRDFNEYRLTPKRNFFARNPLAGTLTGVFTFYFCSATVFCGFMGDNSACPKSEGGPPGWVTAVYFASATISTVGYGDVSIVGSGTEGWRVVIATLFMIVAMVGAVTVFSQLSSIAVESTQGVASSWMAPLFKPFTDRAESKPLWYQLRTVKLIRLFELSLYFVLLNLFGMFVARIIFVAGTEEVDWSWMTTFYWAVQTTTTIGYGDLVMPLNLRWFNVFFTIIGTGYAASLLGSLADLKKEMDNIRRFYVWKNREVSMALIADMEGDNDGQLDEYEFLLGSLITLKKIKREDVKEIMEKFRELAGEDQFITADDIENHNRALSAR